MLAAPRPPGALQSDYRLIQRSVSRCLLNAPRLDFFWHPFRKGCWHPFRKSSRGAFERQRTSAATISWPAHVSYCYQLAYFYRNSQFPQEAQRLKDGQNCCRLFTSTIQYLATYTWRTSKFVALLWHLGILGYIACWTRPECDKASS